MIAIAIIGMIVAISVPVYKGYTEQAQMALVTQHFDTAIGTARQAFLDARIRVANGLQSNLPASTTEWISLFDQHHSAAPGGGNAYTTTMLGDGSTGAIGVSYDETANETTITRPAYRQLTAYQARVNMQTHELTEL